MEKKVAKIIFLDFDGVLNTEYHQRQFCLKLFFRYRYTTIVKGKQCIWL